MTKFIDPVRPTRKMETLLRKIRERQETVNVSILNPPPCAITVPILRFFMFKNGVDYARNISFKNLGIRVFRAWDGTDGIPCDLSTARKILKDVGHPGTQKPKIFIPDIVPAKPDVLHVLETMRKYFDGGKFQGFAMSREEPKVFFSHYASIPESEWKRTIARFDMSFCADWDLPGYIHFLKWLPKGRIPINPIILLILKNKNLCTNFLTRDKD